MTNAEAVHDLPSANGHIVRDRTANAVSSPCTILLIDDNPQVARAVALAFAVAGHHVDTAPTPEAAYSLLARRRYDGILLDLNFTQGQTSGAEGFACLARIVADDPAAAVVVITAHSGIRIAVAAMQAGALDFVIKPWRNTDLVARVGAAIARRVRPARAAADPSTASGPLRLLGDSAEMVAARALIRRVAPTGAGVLVSGPAGSGRSLVAALIHEGSVDADQGATTIDVRDPAVWDRIDDARGTLILREPDALDVVMQDRLLDRLHGMARTIAIVASPGRLSARLRARLATIELALPPLSARGDDALLLARHFAAASAARHGKAVSSFTASAEALIPATHWPDEVRGLAQAIERAVLMGDDGVIDAAALAPLLVQAVAARAPASVAPLGVSLDDAERVMIEAALRRHHHNVSQAASALGLTRQTLYRRMERHGL